MGAEPHGARFGGIAITEVTGDRRLDELEPLWIALHRHHLEHAPFAGYLTDVQLSWTRRRRHYERLLAAAEAIVLLARDAVGPVGYAVARLVDEPDDTFAVRPVFAELESLAVRPDARAAGVGTRLLDDLDARLAALGIVDMTVSVMRANRDALRFYERRGLVPVETVLWRVIPRDAKA